MTDTVAQPVEIEASEETVGSIIDELTTEKPKSTIESEAGVYEAGETESTHTKLTMSSLQPIEIDLWLIHEETVAYMSIFSIVVAS